MDPFTGIVQSINGAKAIVVPDKHPEIVTREFIVPYYWRHEMGNIQPGEKVVCLLDDDMHGYILMRADGEWDYTLRNTLTIEQAVTMNDTLSVQSNVTIGGNMTSTGTVTGGSVTLQTHTHTSTVAGTPTSQPIA